MTRPNDVSDDGGIALRGSLERDAPRDNYGPGGGAYYLAPQHAPEGIAHG